jgi:hypothetical protein
MRRFRTTSQDYFKRRLWQEPLSETKKNNSPKALSSRKAGSSPTKSWRKHRAEFLKCSTRRPRFKEALRAKKAGLSLERRAGICLVSGRRLEQSQFDGVDEFSNDLVHSLLGVAELVQERSGSTRQPAGPCNGLSMEVAVLGISIRRCDNSRIVGHSEAIPAATWPCSRQTVQVPATCCQMSGLARYTTK